MPLKRVATVFQPDGAYYAIIPDYQRDRVWTRSQSARYIGALLEDGKATLPFIFQRWPETRLQRPDEIVDGLQRLSALRDFMVADAPAELLNGQIVRLSDFTPEDQRLLGWIPLTINYVSLPTRADVLRLYLRLNRGGTVHTDEEIERVRMLLAMEQEYALGGAR
jgi:uncharacterized protein with ParB-like and HNH nuclease domain